MLHSPPDAYGQQRPDRVVTIPNQGFQGGFRSSACSVHGIPFAPQVIDHLCWIKRQPQNRAFDGDVLHRIMQTRGHGLVTYTRRRLPVTNHFWTKLEKARVARQFPSQNIIPDFFGTSVVFDERLISQGGQHGGTISGSPLRIELSPKSQSNQRLCTRASLPPPGSRLACAERAVLQIALPTPLWKPFYHDVRQSFQNVPLLPPPWGSNRLPSLNVVQ